MINTEHNGNGVGVGSGGTAAPAHEMQLAGSAKKTALRDVQNENVGLIHKQQEGILPGGGRSSGDTIKVCGTKRLTPERPLSSKGLPSLAHNGTNENVMNARRRFELELGRGRLHNNVEKISKFSESKSTGPLQQEIAQKISVMKDANHITNVPVATSNNLTANTASSSGPLAVPSSFGNQSNSMPVAKVSSDLPRSVDSKITKDQLRAERFIFLQNFLKQCDESDQRDYIQMLLHSSAAELSKRAVELEKRAIQLTIEEGNEIQRMKTVNILAKSSPGKSLLQSTQSLLLPPSKH